MQTAITHRIIAETLAQWAPTAAAESYDNVGILVGYPDNISSGILINLDITEEVLEEAKKLSINTIITHHPIWFVPRKRLTGEDYISKIIMKAIEYNICLIACHTNLDNIRTGVNQQIAAKLGLQNLRFLQNKTGIGEQELGSGMIGDLGEKMPKTVFLEQVKKAFHCGGIRYADSEKSYILKVAICGGSGSFLTHAALQAGADAFVTADITYHKFFDNEGKLLLLDIGHYESEQFTSELIYNYLSEKFTNFALYLSEVYTNPVKYI